MTSQINSQLFFEIMCEKLPMVTNVNKIFKKCVQDVLPSYIATEKAQVTTWVSAYRLVACIEHFPMDTKKKPREIKGPRVGTDVAILEKFMQKYNCTTDDLLIKQIGSDQFYFYLQHNESMPTTIGGGAVIADVLQKMTWPEYMRWGGSFRWIRPIRRICGMYNESCLQYEFPEIPLVTSISTLSHLNDDEEIIYSNSQSYFKQLGSRNVYIDSNERANNVTTQIKSLTTDAGLRLSSASNRVVKEIVACSESPIIYMSEFIDDFELPGEIRQVVMIHHQKYVPLFSLSGKLSTKFLLHSNQMLQDEAALLKQDASKALFARFKEADYFWQKDLSMPLSYHVDMLSRSMLYRDLGSLHQQTSRLEFVMEKYFKDIPQLKEAARYMNIDLCMNTIFEIPELHGTVSGLYAMQKCGVDRRIAQLISEAQHPNGEESLPMDLTPDGARLGLCSRLDTLVGFFGKGHIPKGSSDPFALRRAAFGIVRLGDYIRDLPPIEEIMHHITQLYYDQGIILDKNTVSHVKSFLGQRMEVLLNQISPEFGSNFLLNKFSWKELARVEHFQQYKYHFVDLQKSYRRLNGIIGTHTFADSKDHPRECNQIADMLKKYPLNLNQEPQYFLEFANLIETFLNNTIIHNLDENNRTRVLDLLTKVKRVFDSYCRFG